MRLERLHPTEPVLLVRGLLSEEETATLLGKAQERFNQSLVGGSHTMTTSTTHTHTHTHSLSLSPSPSLSFWRNSLTCMSRQLPLFTSALALYRLCRIARSAYLTALAKSDSWK